MFLLFLVGLRIIFISFPIELILTIARILEDAREGSYSNVDFTIFMFVWGWATFLKSLLCDFL